MENADDVNIAVVLVEIRHAVVSVKQNPDISVGKKVVAITHIWEFTQALRFFIDRLDGPQRSAGIINGDEIVNIAKPLLCFAGPVYFGHV